MVCYRKRVNIAHSLFSHTIDNFAVVEEVPRSLLLAMAVDKSVALITYFLFFYCMLFAGLRTPGFC